MSRIYSTIAVNLTETQIAQIELLAALSGQGRSTLVRSIVQSYIDVTLTPEVAPDVIETAETEVAK